MMEAKDVVKSLAALAQEGRLKIFRELVVAGTQGLTPSVLAERLKFPAATLSFHLKELANAGLIGQERQGRNLIYRTEFNAMQQLLTYLTDNCCQGSVCGVSEAAANSC